MENYVKYITTTIFLFIVGIRIVGKETSRLGKHYDIKLEVKFNDIFVFDAIKNVRFFSKKPADSVINWEVINGECKARCFKNPTHCVLTDRNGNQFFIEL